MHADYGAFMYQIREANKESENVIEFGCKTYDIICNTCEYNHYSLIIYDVRFVH